MEIACFFLADFPAWAFAQTGAARRGIVVVSSGRVIAADRTAKRAGVVLGTSAGLARSLAPEAAVYTHDTGLEVAAWENTLAEVHTLTPFLEDIGPGWAFLRGADPPALHEIAERLGAGIGLAARRAEARLAALRAAPGHVLSISNENRGAFLQRFPIRMLEPLGFSADLLERLYLLGYRDLATASTLTRRQLDAQFAADGVRLYDLLHPVPVPPVGLFQPPPVIAESIKLDEPLRQPGELQPIVQELVDRAAGRLGPLFCARMALVLQVGAETRRTSRILRTGTSEVRALRTASAALLAELLGEDGEVGEIIVELGALARGVARQSGLFMERHSVHVAVRGVHRRYPGAMVRAVVVPNALFDEDGAYFEPFPNAPATKRRARSRPR
ncbi:hypothetical protein BH23BAC4_BH23BAC4_10840 [soil metagenome]